MYYIHYSSFFSSIFLFFLLTDFLPSLNGLLPPPLRSLSLLLQDLLQILSPIEYTTRSSATSSTRRILPIPLQRTRLAEVVPTLRDDRVIIRLLTNDTREWDLL